MAKHNPKPVKNSKGQYVCSDCKMPCHKQDGEFVLMCECGMDDGSRYGSPYESGDDW